jgi:hypothetical protein
VIPVSDTHVWPTQSAVDAAMAEFGRFRDECRAHINDHDRDDPLKAQAIAFVLGLDDVEHRMRMLLTAPVRVEAKVAVPLEPRQAEAERPEPTNDVPVAVGGPKHRVGERTDPNLRRIRGNRGSWSGR